MESALEVIVNYNHQLKEQNKALLEEQARLTEKVAEYENKFSTYTKEQACLLFKIEQVKKILNDAAIKKTGKNSFQNYSYYELEDINKPITDALISKGLASLFNFKNDTAYLQIIDSETGAWIQWHTELRKSDRWINNQKNSTKKGDVGEYMKANQALQTYARRTLYLQALEIAEPNVIEQPSYNENKKQHRSAKSDEFKIPENTDETTKDILTKIQKDFGNRVQFTNNTLRNKVHSLEKVYDEKDIEKLVTTLQTMGYKL